MTTESISRLFPASTRLATRARRVTQQSSFRILDLTVSTLLLLVTLPLLLLLALAVRCSGPGPVLFRQTRVGRGGSPFRMLKFRTMHDGCAESPHRDYVTLLLAGQASPTDGLYKLAGDPRVTRIGALLRRTSLDELPQLLNVLRGHMSLVGPRPCLTWEFDLLPEWSAPRFTVRPGMTGLWQISGRNRLGMLDGLRLDVDYVARKSLVLDLVILVRTIPAVLLDGAR